MLLTLTLAYKMSIGQAAIVSVISICIVMIILAIMTGILALLGMFLKANKKNKEEVKENNAKKDVEENVIKNVVLQPMPEQSVNVANQGIIAQLDDKQLIAVITAAIAASANTTTDKIIVRSIRKVNSWKNTALKEKASNIY